jgi:hypothetical protein
MVRPSGEKAAATGWYIRTPSSDGGLTGSAAGKRDDARNDATRNTETIDKPAP